VARFVKVSQNEFVSVRKLYESVMSYACHGLFFREGATLADEIAREVVTGEDLLLAARKILIDRGWVEDVQFTKGGARAYGSIEASPGSAAETCHRLRGILSRLTTIATKERSRLAEVECTSKGARECVFAKEES
jgi:predicted hydrocarbon binding protein